ncbi:hypothetical protein OBV_30510 [Oscillibacter valericigenes Sjm18-20]|nr:hypothetical protein OBV_30510 [Oscillibacter valericigenes Sjm18-20]
MFEHKNIFVLNKKDKEAIIYQDADGRIIRLTREVFASEEEFMRWKGWSDENYHDAEKARHVESNHAIYLEELPEGVANSESPEERYISDRQKQERQRLCDLLMAGYAACLTDKQRRRLWLHYVEKLSVRQIAAAESVSFQTVAESIIFAKKKIETFLKKYPDESPFQRR